MKKILGITLAILAFSGGAQAQKHTKSKPKTPARVQAKASTAVSDKEIHWISLDELQQRMKAAPRKVYIDVYTPWCGWCKVMDQKTFTNPNVIKYINEHYYAVKFNAEQTDSVHFMGGHYGLEGRTNQFAVQLLRGQLSYPTTVIMEENFQNPQLIPGYQDVKNIEPILKYLAENHYKATPFDEYMKSFKASWEQ